MKDTRLRLGIDVDGIFSDFVASYREVCMKVVGRPLPEAVTDWGMSNWGLTAAEHKKAWELVTNTRDFYLLLPPYEEIWRDRGALIDFNHKHRLYFITSRATTIGMPIEMQTAYWLASKCGVTFPTVIVEEQKGQIAAALKLHAMIDDRPENLAAVQEHSPNTVLYLRDRSWNQNAHHVIDGPYTRVHSFAEFIDCMEEAADAIAA